MSIMKLTLSSRQTVSSSQRGFVGLDSRRHRYSVSPSGFKHFVPAGHLSLLGSQTLLQINGVGVGVWVVVGVGVCVVVGVGVSLGLSQPPRVVIDCLKLCRTSGLLGSRGSW